MKYVGIKIGKDHIDGDYLTITIECDKANVDNGYCDYKYTLEQFENARFYVYEDEK